MKEVLKYLTKDMSDFKVWKIDKITDFKVWWFATFTLKLKKLLNKSGTTRSA